MHVAATANSHSKRQTKSLIIGIWGCCFFLKGNRFEYDRMVSASKCKNSVFTNDTDNARALSHQHNKQFILITC